MIRGKLPFDYLKGILNWVFVVIMFNINIILLFKIT